MKIIQYEHNFTGGGTSLNYAFEPLVGKHRVCCLCFSGCKNFKPGTEENCIIAQSLYNICVLQGVVTPVFECPKFTVA